MLDYHARETERLAAEVKAGKVAQPDFVLWPENSSDIDPFANADARAVIDAAAKAIGAPISVGGVVERDGKLYNEQILWDPEKGPVDTYDKRQIQPFGEYLPLRSLVGASTRTGPPWSARTSAGAPSRACSPWPAPRSASSPATRPPSTGRCASEVTDGAQMISVPSNNATFDRSEMTYQQLAMSRVRAVEHSRTVTVPVTSGVSAIIMPDGEDHAEDRHVRGRLAGAEGAAAVLADPRHHGSASCPRSPWCWSPPGGLGWAVGAGLRGRRAGDA